MQLSCFIVSFRCLSHSFHSIHWSDGPQAQKWFSLAKNISRSMNSEHIELSLNSTYDWRLNFRHTFNCHCGTPFHLFFLWIFSAHFNHLWLNLLVELFESLTEIYGKTVLLHRRNRMTNDSCNVVSHVPVMTGTRRSHAHSLVRLALLRFVVWNWIGRDVIKWLFFLWDAFGTGRFDGLPRQRLVFGRPH